MDTKNVGTMRFRATTEWHTAPGGHMAQYVCCYLGDPEDGDPVLVGKILAVPLAEKPSLNDAARELMRATAWQLLTSTFGKEPIGWSEEKPRGM